MISLDFETKNLFTPKPCVSIEMLRLNINGIAHKNIAADNLFHKLYFSYIQYT